MRCRVPCAPNRAVLRRCASHYRNQTCDRSLLARLTLPRGQSVGPCTPGGEGQSIDPPPATFPTDQCAPDASVAHAPHPPDGGASAARRLCRTFSDQLHTQQNERRHPKWPTMASHPITSDPRAGSRRQTRWAAAARCRTRRRPNRCRRHRFESHGRSCPPVVC